MAQFGRQRFDLLASLFEGPGTVDLLRGMTQLLFHRHLRGDTAARFLFAEAARKEAFELLLRAAPGDDKAVKMFVHAGLDEQGGFDERGVARAVALPFVELAGNHFTDPRVNNGVETLEFGAILEHNRSKLGTVYPALIVGDGRAKFVKDLLVGWLAGLDKFVSQRIGVKNRKPEFAQDLSDNAFAAGNSAGQSKSQHLFESPCRGG